MQKQEKIIIGISIVGLMLMFAVYNYLPSILMGIQPPDGNFIGLVVKVQNDVKIRYGDSITWQTTKENDHIYSNTYLFTGRASSGSYAFLDESMITLGENSLIQLDFSITAKDQGTKPLEIKVVDGSNIEIDLKENSQIQTIIIDDALIDIGTEKTTISLNKEEDGFQVSALRGDVNIERGNKKYKVKPGEMIGLSKSEPMVEPIKSKVPPELMEKMEHMREEHQRQRKSSSSSSVQRVTMFEVFERLGKLFTWMIPD